ncbi:unnamed protein product [Moneuplotes crassus]|uniref:Uncharacterized protein n=1 Tax=Euplotes crassus TaxID=5936 RepID=A0AAD1UAT2_EUPCR|nr:unnamed protein product [Moneuplotes crassus]
MIVFKSEGPNSVASTSESGSAVAGAEIGCYRSCTSEYILYSISFRDDPELASLDSQYLSVNSLSTCGDGNIQSSHMEECDYGDRVDGDGCSESCLNEGSTSCVSNAMISCTSLDPAVACGNGRQDNDEDCDDENSISGDGCTSCVVDSGWICTSPQSSPSVCIEQITQNCGVEFCSQCQQNISDKCSECQSGYKLNRSSQCVTEDTIVISSYAESTANSSKYVSSSAGVIALLVSMLQGSAPMVLWSIINQVQITQLLVLKELYIPDDAKAMLSGEGGIPINPSMRLVDDFPYVTKFKNWIDINQTNSDLKIIGVESGSSLKNCLNLIVVLVLLACFTGILWILPSCKPKQENQKCRSLYWKGRKKLLNLLVFTVYIRIIYECFQFALLSSFSGIQTYHSNYQPKYLVSLVSSVIFLILCVGFLCCALYSFCVSVSSESGDSYKSREFANGLKHNKAAKLYSVLGLSRRLMFCCWLMICNSLPSIVNALGVLVIQTPYLGYILFVRPLDKVPNKIIECINELIFFGISLFLCCYSSETSWSKVVSNIFINVILANNIIITLIISTTFTLTLLSLIKGCFRSKSRTRPKPSQRKPQMLNLQRAEPQPTQKRGKISAVSAAPMNRKLEIIKKRIQEQPVFLWRKRSSDEE